MNDGHPAHDAVRAFWKARSVAAAKQAATGRQDRGSRGAVTAGTHLKALEDIVVAEFIAAGLAPSTIRRKAGLGLPGYYRPA
ncbi:MAG TPA: PaeR7I family type II restriction endonuclease, partial [Micromonosporaceae bacterium]|nr:PaeR7I family type II restriction endonuclease [Micromonosporaceae bacterium]